MKQLMFGLILLLAAYPLSATHNRSGEISYKRVAPYSSVTPQGTVSVYNYSITVIRYTDHGPLIADRCVDTVYFGDGQKGIAPRINGGTALGCSCSGTIQCGQLIVQQSGYTVKKNVYSIVHTYPGAGLYKIYSADPYRNAGIHNIPNSGNTLFYLEATLIISNLSAFNSSPEFAAAPVNQATLGICFSEQPMLSDADGDSLIVEMIPCATISGSSMPGYFYPEIPVNGSYNIVGAQGPLVWCYPLYVATYQIAYKVNEWRQNGSSGYSYIGSVMREREVIVNWGPVGINELSKEKPFTLYPNPAGTELLINSEEEFESEGPFTLIDLSGRSSELKPLHVTGKKVQFDLSDLESGLYLLRIEHPGRVDYLKLVKE